MSYQLTTSYKLVLAYYTAGNYPEGERCGALQEELWEMWSEAEPITYMHVRLVQRVPSAHKLRLQLTRPTEAHALEFVQRNPPF